jgi:polysaccharide biosynthesis/export protein
VPVSRALLVGIVALLVASSSARAQPRSLMDPAPAVEKAMEGNGQAGPPIPIGFQDETEVLGAEREGRSSSPAPISIDQPINPDQYMCGPGDVFEINFWGKQNFRLEIAADLEGNAFISKIGFVKIAGKSLTAVRGVVRKLIKRDYPGLGFEVTLKRPRSFIVHVANNVKSPGAYPANATERVATLIARAGDTTKVGSRRRIAIKRDGKELIADLFLYETTGDTKFNPFVLDGDVISVPFPETQVTVGGAVRRPGTYELVGSKDVTELLQLAGGFTTSVAKNLPIRVMHRNANQQATYKDLAFAKGSAAPNEPLIDDDEVIVPSAAELQRSVLLIGPVAGADPVDQATTSRRLPYVDGDTVRSLIERAGGIKSPGDLQRSYLSRPRKNEDPLLIPIDLEALIVRRDFSADRPVMMGDTITIPPKRHGIVVQGAVGRPGVYNFNPAFGIAEYVADAGGATRTARDLDEARIIAPDGRRARNRGVQPGDVILVPERTFTRPEIVQIVIASAGLLLSGVAITLAASR